MYTKKKGRFIAMLKHLFSKKNRNDGNKNMNPKNKLSKKDSENESKNEKKEMKQTTKSLIVFYFAIVLVMSFLASFSYQTNSIGFKRYEVGDVARETIESPKKLEIVDEEKTAEKKEELMKKAEDKYFLNQEIGQSSINKVNVFFEELIRVKEHRNEAELIKTEIKNLEKEKKKLEKDKKNQEQVKNISDDLKKLNRKLNEINLNFNTEKNTLNLEQNDINTLLAKLDTEKLKKANENINKVLEETYEKEISENNLDEAKRNFASHPNISLMDSDVKLILIPKIIEQLKHNLFMDEEAVKEEKEKIEKEFTPVFINVQKGEIVIRKGEVIQEEHMIIFKELGILETEFSVKDFFAIAFFAFIIYSMLSFVMIKYELQQYTKKSVVVFLFSSITFAVFVNNVINDVYVTCFLLVFLLVTFSTFLKANITVFYAIALGSLMDVNNFELLLFSVVLGTVLMITHKPFASRTEILNTGVLLGGVGSVVLLSLRFSNIQEFSIEFLYPIIIGSLIGTAASIGLFPYLEKILGTTTSTRLSELTKLDHPLIKRLVNEANGTYHHSIRVASMAEIAAEKIGANHSLVKIAAYFHDVGKLMNPQYFIENQVGDKNPHDYLTPEASAEIIKRHPENSVNMCREYGIPEEVISIIETHHGDSLIQYFYQKAKKELGDNVDSNKFRYNTPKPKTKEQGILLLADGTEAYSRTLVNETAKVIKKKIEKFIDDKVFSGVLDDSELTISDIEIIKKCFVDFILSSNHKRIKYEN